MQDTLLKDENEDTELLAIQLSLLHVHERGNKAIMPNPLHSRQRGSSSISIPLPVLVCDVCDKSMNPNQPYEKGGYWNQTFCSTHLKDGTPICIACNRLKVINVTYIELGDDRLICQDCYQSAVLDSKTHECVLRKCHEFFESLNMKIHVDIPFFLVDTPDMLQLCSDVNDIESSHPVIWGLTMYNQRPVVSTITSSSRFGNIITVEKQPPNDSLGSNPISVAVLFGFTEAMTGAILTHEMMHVWLQLQLQRINEELEVKVKEGICQVIARRWLDWFETSLIPYSSSSEYNNYIRNLLTYYKMQVEEDCSIAYGEGFREAQWATSKLGLHETINHILTHRHLPIR